ncbi:MAG TPA: hypothetical protein VE398_21055 [Acidobacteriota bacterium]|nr:hypothetical protein [Acidobacteriota bacterium]
MVSILQPFDVINLTRTPNASLALSVIRRKRLLVAIGAVTAVPLGEDIEVRQCWDLYKKVGDLFHARDPDFDLPFCPVEVTVGNQTRVLAGGQVKIGNFEVFVAHPIYPEIDGTDENVAISRIGLCSEVAAAASALLLEYTFRFTLF